MKNYISQSRFNELENGLQKEPSEQNVQQHAQLETSSDDEPGDTQNQHQNQFSVVLNGKGGHLYFMENGLTSQTLKNHVPSEWLKTVHRKQSG